MEGWKVQGRWETGKSRGTYHGDVVSVDERLLELRLDGAGGCSLARMGVEPRRTDECVKSAR